MVECIFIRRLYSITLCCVPKQSSHYRYTDLIWSQHTCKELPRHKHASLSSLIRSHFQYGVRVETFSLASWLTRSVKLHSASLGLLKFAARSSALLDSLGRFGECARSPAFNSSPLSHKERRCWSSISGTTDFHIDSSWGNQFNRPKLKETEGLRSKSQNSKTFW